MKPSSFLPLSCLLASSAWAQTVATVHVVNGANAPIRAAAIEVRPLDMNDDATEPVMTGANGDAKISLPWIAHAKQAAGMIMVAAKGFAPAALVVSKSSAEIKLKEGATWRGRVVDDSGKPISGAKITLVGAMPEGDFSAGIWLANTKLAERYVALSGADGSFVMADVPTDLKLVYIVSHPRFGGKRGQEGSAQAEELIKLPPGGSIRGRILSPTGEPVARVSVSAVRLNGYSDSGTRTDKNGNFALEGLTTGEYQVDGMLPDGSTQVLARSAKVRIGAGTVVDMPVMQTQQGKTIRGQVRDAVTKKPIEHANVMATVNNETSAYTSSNAQGRFTLYVAPGKYQVHMYSAPTGYFRSTIQSHVNVGAAPVTPLLFELQEAVEVRGITVDEKGKLVAARLQAGRGQEVKSDAAGKWEYMPSDNDPLAFGGGEDESGYFEVVGDSQFEMPVREAVVVKVRWKPWNTITGRTLAADGSPLPGVKLSTMINVPTGGGYSLGIIQSAVSDAEGRFVFQKVRGQSDIVIAGQKSGFSLVSGGKVSGTGTALTAEDMVFANMNLRLEGKTVPGARVVTAGREVVADAQGKFVFDGLPAGRSTVFAAKDGQFGSVLITGDGPVDLALKPVIPQDADPELVALIQAEALQNVKGLDKGQVQGWSQPVAARFEDRLAKAGAGNGEYRDYYVAEVINTWKKGDSFEALIEALESLKDSSSRVTSYLRAAIWTGDEGLMRKALEIAEAAIKTPSQDIDSREGILYLMAPVAERVDGEKAGLLALNRAVAYTIQSHGEKTVVKDGTLTESGRDQVMAEQAKTIASGSISLVRHLVEAIEPGSGNDIRALAEAIPVLAKTHDVDAVLPLLDELEKKEAPKQISGPRYSILDPGYAFGAAARALVPLLGQQSPSGGLALAQRITDEMHRPRALASAARRLDGEEAEKIWRQAVDEARPEEACRFAAFVWQTNPKLGAELFDVAYLKVEAAMASTNYFGNAWIYFAFYSARADAARARLILEREWPKALAAKMEAYNLASVAEAMAPIDARRAWEMAQQVPQDAWANSSREKIVRYLVSTPQQRANFVLQTVGSETDWEAEGINF
jgi:hypothetical protein